MRWQNPGLICVFAKRELWDSNEDDPYEYADKTVPINVKDALYEIWSEEEADRQRTLDDIGWIGHELDGLG